MQITSRDSDGFGAVEPAALVFTRNKLVPLPAEFLTLNGQLDSDAVKFTDYVLRAAASTGGQT